MSSTRFLETISNALQDWLPPLSSPSKLEIELAKLNPERIYIENVRSVLGISYSQALRICNTAVRRKVFTKGIEILCPNSSVAKTVQHNEPIPEYVVCIVETEDGYEEEQFATSDLQTRTFYAFAN